MKKEVTMSIELTRPLVVPKYVTAVVKFPRARHDLKDHRNGALGDYIEVG
jgi:hypothetical protein